MNVPLTLDRVMRHAQSVYAKTEIVSLMSETTIHRYTFGDAFRRVAQLANALTKLEIDPGDRVATIAFNDYRHFELYYGISCSAYVCHTINPRLFDDQISFIINDASDQYVFVDPAFVPTLERIADQLQSVKGFVVLCGLESMPSSTLPNLMCYESLLEVESEVFSWPELQDENLACALCYTSGTTGDPKGVLYSHRSVVLHSYAVTMPDVAGLSSRKTAMPMVPMYHVNAWGMPYACAMVGTKMVFPGSFSSDARLLTDLINQEQVTVSLGVPTVFQGLLNYLQVSGRSVPSLEQIQIGGAPCPLALSQAFEAFDVWVTVGWGMTETSPLGATNCVSQGQDSNEIYDERRTKAGRPVFGVEMKILDEKGRELPRDGRASGTLNVRGPWVASGYFGDAEAPESPELEWFDTGDVATIDADGFMNITDRVKDLIKSGGEWISSQDIERVALDHPAIAAAAVVGIAHPKWGERPLLLAVPVSGVDIEEAEVLKSLEGRVARWWVPDECVFVDDLPLTSIGKLNKKLLREQFSKYVFSELSK